MFGLLLFLYLFDKSRLGGALALAVLGFVGGLIFAVVLLLPIIFGIVLDAPLN